MIVVTKKEYKGKLWATELSLPCEKCCSTSCSRQNACGEHVLCWWSCSTVCAGHAGLALYASALWYEGYVVALQCCWALQCFGTADSSLSCLDLCQLTLALPLLCLRMSMAEAENQIQSCVVGSAYHSHVVCSLAFLGLFGNSVPLTVRVTVTAIRIENAYLNAAPVCPSSPSQHFKVNFSHFAAALLYFPYSHISHVPKTEVPWKIKWPLVYLNKQNVALRWDLKKRHVCRICVGC